MELPAASPSLPPRPLSLGGPRRVAAEQGGSHCLAAAAGQLPHHPLPEAAPQHCRHSDTLPGPTLLQDGGGREQDVEAKVVGGVQSGNFGGRAEGHLQRDHESC